MAADDHLPGQGGGSPSSSGAGASAFSSAWASVRSRMSDAQLSNDFRKKKQKGLLLAVGAALLVLIGGGLVMSPEAQKGKTKNQITDTDLTLHPDRAQREAYSLMTERALEKLSMRIDSLEKGLSEMRLTYQDSVTNLKGSVRSQEELIRSLDRDRRAWVEYQAKASQSKASPSNSSPSSEAASENPYDQADLDRQIRNAAPVTPQNSAYVPEGGRLAMVTLTPPKDERRLNAPRFAPAPIYEYEKPLAVNRAAGTTVETYIPAGSFVRATLLTGVYAPTGGAGASQAMPVLMRLDAPAVLPNRWKSKVDSCHVTGSATGDISSERTLIRLDRLSCVGKKGETLDIQVSGYAVGSDGKVGVRSTLVTRSGQAIAAALSTAVLSGLGKAVSLSAQSVTTNATGLDTVRYDNALQAGLGQGLASGFDRIVDHYLKLASHIFPVLEVDSGTPLDLVISQGTILRES